MDYYPTALGIYPRTYSLTYATVTGDCISDRFMCEDIKTIKPYPEETIPEKCGYMTERCAYMIDFLIDCAGSCETTFIGVTSPFDPKPDELRLEGAILSAIYNSDLKTADLFHLDPRKFRTPFGNEYKYRKDVYTHIWQIVEFPQSVSNMSEWKLDKAMAVAAAVTTLKIYPNPPMGNSTYRGW